MALLPENPQTRKTVLYGVFLLLAASWLVYDYLYRPQAEEVVALEERLDLLELQNRTARGIAASEGRGDMELRLGRYREQLVRVEGLIPSSEELPDLLDAISAEARRTGVDLSLIQPVGAEAEQYYVRRTYDLAVVGSFHQIGSFLGRVASLPRIITPSNLNLTVRDQEPGSPPVLEARFSIETYVLPSEAPASNDTAHAE